MDFKSIDGVKKEGFMDFNKISELRTGDRKIPQIPGVYFVLNPNNENAEFLEVGSGGHFKGRNPNVPIAELKFKHVKNTVLVYIGKADNLGKRIGQLLKFGRGMNVGHYGGRYLWQLKNHEDLVICYIPSFSEDPRELEKKYIRDFEKQYGKKPFANIKG